MIEFTIALVAIMAVFIGMIILNKMESARVSTMIKARGTAGARALDPIYHGAIDAQFISDWQAGADNSAYTHDDQPIPDGTAIALVGNITANSGLGSIAAPSNNLSKLQSFPDISAFYLIKGSESEAVDLQGIPGARRLFGDEHAVSVRSDAWLAWAGGIY